MSPFWLFQPYVQNYFGNKLNNEGYSWNDLILLNCERDESQALDKFFKLFDEFQKIQPIGAFVAITSDVETKHFQTQDNIYRTRFDENGKEVDYGPANSIYIIKYSNNFGCALYYKFNNLEINSEFCSSVQEARGNVEREYGSNITWTSGETDAALSDLYSKASTN